MITLLVVNEEKILQQLKCINTMHFIYNYIFKIYTCTRSSHHPLYMKSPSQYDVLRCMISTSKISFALLFSLFIGKLFHQSVHGLHLAGLFHSYRLQMRSLVDFDKLKQIIYLS